MTTNKEQVAITAAKHEPSVGKNPRKWLRKIHGYEKESPKLYEDEAQSSKIQSNEWHVVNPQLITRQHPKVIKLKMVSQAKNDLSSNPKH